MWRPPTGAGIAANETAVGKAAILGLAIPFFLILVTSVLIGDTGYLSYKVYQNAYPFNIPEAKRISNFTAKILGAALKKQDKNEISFYSPFLFG